MSLPRGLFGSLHLVIGAGANAAAVRSACRGGVDFVHCRGAIGTSVLQAVHGGGAVTVPRSQHPLPLATPPLLQQATHLTSHDVRNTPDGTSLPPGFVGGASCHSVSEAQAALRAVPGLHYLLVGTMYPTPSHSDKDPESPLLLRRISDALGVRCPDLVAIGGVLPSRVAEVVAHGATGVAVSRHILDASCPEAAAAELKAELLARLAQV